MNYTHTAVFIVCSIALGLFATAARGAGAAEPAEPDTGDAKGELLHIVTLKFQPGATPEQIGLIEQSFAGLKEKIPCIVSLKWGTNVSPEKKDKGFTHCFVLAFASERDRDAYVVHEEHKAFVEILKPILEDVLVLDFWTGH